MAAPTPESRLPHGSGSERLDNPSQQVLDCRAVGANLRLDRILRAAVAGPPSLHFDDYPREVPKREIEISEAAASLADALHLRFD